jgi:hypothetical protein
VGSWGVFSGLVATPDATKLRNPRKYLENHHLSMPFWKHYFPASFLGWLEGKLFNGNLLKKCVSCRFSHKFRQLNTKFLVIDEYYALPKHVSGYLLDVFIEIQYGPIISNHLSKGIPTPKGRIP